MLTYLDQQKASGVLIVEKSGSSLEIYFSSGCLIGVGCNSPKSYCAGIPYPFQRLPHSVVAEAVRLQQVSNIPFFLTVWRLKHHPSDVDLRQLLVMAAVRITAKALRQLDHLAFKRVQHVPDYVREFPLQIPVFSVLFESYRLVEDWATIERTVSSMSGIYSRIPHTAEYLSMFYLNAAEKNVLQGLDGRRTIGQVAHGCGLDVYEVCKIVYRFVEVGLLELIGHEQLGSCERKSGLGTDDPWLSPYNNAVDARNHFV